MSVAFRRESDEEHKEPRFELPIPAGPNLVTTAGMALIDARIAALEAEEPADDIRREGIARERRYWNTRRTTAVLAPRPPVDEVAFGSVVRIRLDGAERTIAIVGDDEADPATDRLAFGAPLARALIGAGEGDTLDFAGREGAIEILRIDSQSAPNA